MSDTRIKDAFTQIYDQKDWGDLETVSGEGSTLENTLSIRSELPDIFKKFGVRSVVDAPCGDHWWFGNCEYDLDSYIGVDVVEDIIEVCKKRYGDKIRDFVCMDLAATVVPKADIIVCRDCLIHLSDDDALDVLRNFKKSGSTYLLISTDPSGLQNSKIKSGAFRHVNLLVPPFMFPEPILLLNEKDRQAGGVYNRRSLGLWDMKTIPDL